MLFLILDATPHRGGSHFPSSIVYLHGGHTTSVGSLNIDHPSILLRPPPLSSTATVVPQPALYFTNCIPPLGIVFNHQNCLQPPEQPSIFIESFNTLVALYKVPIMAGIMTAHQPYSNFEKLPVPKPQVDQLVTRESLVGRVHLDKGKAKMSAKLAPYNATALCQNKAVSGRDKWSDIDHPYMPPMNSFFKIALEDANKDFLCIKHPQDKMDDGYLLPDPGFFVNILSPKSLVKYLAKWLACHPTWIEHVYDERPRPLPRAQNWLDFLISQQAQEPSNMQMSGKTSKSKAVTALLFQKEVPVLQALWCELRACLRVDTNPNVGFVLGFQYLAMVSLNPIAGLSTPPSHNTQHELITSSMVKRRRRPQQSCKFHLPIAPPLLVLPGRKHLTQQSLNHSGRSQQQQPLRNTNTANQHDSPSAGNTLEHEEHSSFYSSLHYISDGDSILPSPSKGCQKKMNQWRRWTDKIIPSLIAPYLTYLRKSTSLRN
ncbi:hypothetical protein EV702DRAFT_1202557 [Suillus placidus]|uniref:Uncharacterized protein n=1 Tax=Suillus placidus TaxID=48579 RepID=A0A9P7CXW2_9AGAM|nr:hypothetical protein EV702DRAFT_1202557 [Suillus placidus]